jgi:hypothetical protein
LSTPGATLTPIILISRRTVNGTSGDPQRYTVIDFRALESLGTKCSTFTVGFYLAYLKHCRELATQYNLSLRTLDRALWQWSYERKPSDASA